MTFYIFIFTYPFCRIKYTNMCECGHSGSQSVSQSLDEMEFERGLWFAAQYGDMERALHLLNNGFNVDQRDAAGYTALHYAARNGHLDLCRLLLDRGACVNAVTESGKATPMHRAATVGKLAIVEYLIEKKGDTNLKDVDGKTVLHRAATNGHKDICQLLVKRNPGLRKEFDKHNKRPADYCHNTELLTILN